MDFVFVGDAMAARVFLAAGATHVIESTSALFIEKFYQNVWRPGSTICDSFWKAKRDSEADASIYCKPHECPVFGQF